MFIYLDLLLPTGSSDLPETDGPPYASFWSCFEWGLHMPHKLPCTRWSLKPPFHPYQHMLAVYFCCTILGVTSTGRYPASCPVKPGLSSLRRESLVTPANREHLSYSYFITCFLSNKSHFSITQSLASILNPYTLKQLSPINSLKIELFGIRLLSTPTK